MKVCWHRFLLTALVLSAPSAVATDIPIVFVGNPGNPGEASGGGNFGPPAIVGNVNYAFQIGKYEVTVSQYVDFLNAVARTDTYELYNPAMPIVRSGSPGTYIYSVGPANMNKPIGYVSWGDAARLSNWLTNGQPTGLQNLLTTEDGSYYLNGATTPNQFASVVRKSGAIWVIPNENEWYKAAYHKNDGATAHYWDYPTSSDSISPLMANYGDVVGSATNVGSYVNYFSPYGTFDQGGNLWEWTETAVLSPFRLMRGGGFWSPDIALMALARYGYDANPTLEALDVGFRVAIVPEPATVCLLLLTGTTLGRRRNRR